MKKFYSFFLVAVCLFATSFAYAATRTVYFQDNNNWANQNGGIYIYLKSSSDATYENAQEPGVAVTENVATNLYKFTIEDDTFDKLKFSNNGNWPTGELEIKDNGVYKSDGYYTKFVPVCFDNFKSDWANVTIHHWENKVAPLQLETKGNVYSWLVAEEADFLFYTGKWEDGQQTGNLKEANRIYYYDKTVGGKTQIVSFPLNLYAMGNVYVSGTYTFGNDGNTTEELSFWNPADGSMRFDYLGSGIYSIKNIEMYPREDQKVTNGYKSGYAKMRFHTALGDWNSLGDTYEPADDWKFDVLASGKTKTVKLKYVAGNTDNGFFIYSTFDASNSRYYTYDMNVNLVDMTLKFDGTTGVESISIEDSTAPVEYFNLQGVRVENPENGLYIVRQGNKVSKQLIR